MREIECLRTSSDHDQFLKSIQLCIRVFIVPSEKTEEFNTSLKLSDNASGQRAHWSTVQFRACAILDEALVKSNESETTSFLDKVSVLHVFLVKHE